MDPFVRRLVERLNDPGRPLSRNRHFHTFDTPEGRAALRLSRRLQSLARDILASCREGHVPNVTHTPDAQDEDALTVELRFERIGGRRVSRLRPAEWELLTRMPGVAQALGPRDDAATG